MNADSDLSRYPPRAQSTKRSRPLTESTRELRVVVTRLTDADVAAYRTGAPAIDPGVRAGSDQHRRPVMGARVLLQRLDDPIDVACRSGMSADDPPRPFPYAASSPVTVSTSTASRDYETNDETIIKIERDELNGYTFESEIEIENTCWLDAQRTKGIVDQTQLFDCNDCRITFTSKRRFERHITSSHKSPTEPKVNNFFRVNTMGNGINTISKTADFGNCFNNKPEIDARSSLRGIAEKSNEIVHKLCLFVCNVCQKSFATESRILRHLSKSHTTISKIKQTRQEVEIPDWCGKKYSRNDDSCKYKSKLKLHERLYADKSPYKCDICEKQFAHNYTLKMHMRVHTDDNPYECTVCNKKFSSMSYLKIHNRVHTGEKPFECTVCNKMFSSIGYLKIHNRAHTDKKPYFECIVCNKAFSSMSYLRIHNRLHTGEKLFECTVCDKTFSSNSSLRMHNRVHTGEKPFECTVCNKMFRSNGSLKMHNRVHTGEKPFECTVCNKMFNQSSSLTVHMRIHTGRKPYECIVCNKTFSCISYLKIHYRMHTGEKPFECTVCNKTFSRNSNFIMHKRKHTGEK